MESKNGKLLVFGWTLLAIFLPWGIWWEFHIPTPGKGGLLLALVATLMPIFWEKHGAILKSAWILTLFVVFYVEYRAIDKDRRDFADEQKQARKVERESFDKLLNQEKQNLKDILDGEGKNLKTILDTEQRNFDRTLRENRQAQQQERQDFFALLRKEEDLFKNQEELYEFSTGKMLPADDPMPTLCGPPSEKDFIVQMGDTAFSTDTLPLNILSVGDEPVISIDKSETGSLTMSVDLRTNDGTIIAKLDKNGWLSNPAMGLLMRRDKHGISLFDSRGKEILNARYLNTRSFRISGIVPYRGRAIPLPLPMFKGCSHMHGVGTVMAL